MKEICPEFPGGPITAHWSIPDPAAGGSSDETSYELFVRTAEEIETRVDLLIAELAFATGKERSANAFR